MKKRLLTILKHPRSARVALGLYVCCVVALIGTYMAVSNRDVRRAAYFQTTEVLEIDRPSAMRGAFLDAQTGQFLNVRDVRVELSGGHLLGTGAVGPAGVVHMELRPKPELEAGLHRLQVSAIYPDGERFTTEGSIVLSEPFEDPKARRDWPKRSLRDEPQERPRPVVEAVEAVEAVDGEDKSPGIRKIALSVYPTDGELVRGLGNVVFLRATDAETGAPIQTKFRLGEAKGIFDGELPKEVVTNRLGLARIAWTPITDGEWKVVLAGSASKKATSEEQQPETWTIRWRTVPAQFSLVLNEPVARPGERVRGRVESLFQSGGFFVDLYEGRRWLDSAAYGLSPQGGGFEVDVPPLVTEAEAPLFYRLQVYQSFYAPSRAWDAAYLVRIDERSPEGLQMASRRLVAFIAEHVDDAYYRGLLDAGLLELATPTELTQGLEAYALAIPRGFEAPKILINTQQADREALEIWKEKVKKDLMILTFLVFFAGLIVLTYFVTLGVMRHRREAALIAEIDLELDDDDDEAAFLARQKSASLERVVVVLQAGIVLVTIVAFALGILMLLSYL